MQIVGCAAAEYVSIETTYSHVLFISIM